MASGKEIRGQIMQRRKHEENYQGYGNGGRIQNAQGAGPDALQSSI